MAATMEERKHNENDAAMEEDDDSKIFPQRLMEILSDERNQASICWLPHGRAFVIRDRKLFAETVMPRYFSRKAKYSSFTRKLNRWNFVRVSSGPEIGSYYHEFFLRDKPHLAAQMFCKNARTMLAMASATDGPKPAPSPVAGQPSQPPPTNGSNAMTVTMGGGGQHPAAVTSAVPSGIPNPALPDPMMTVPHQQNPLPQQPLTNPALQDPAQAVAAVGGANSVLEALAKQAGDPGNSNELKGALLGSVPMNTLQFLERQMQVLQQEQANRLIMEQAVALSLQQQHRPMHSPLTINQHARLLQMQELMEIRLRQQKGRVPTNSRASAA